MSDSAVAASWRARSSPGRRSTTLKSTHATTAEHDAAASTPTLASSSCSPSNARPAISSATVKPMPATAPPPASVGHATGGCRRLRSSLTASQGAATMPTGLPTT